MTDQKPNCSTCKISHCPIFTQPGNKPTDSSVHSKIEHAIEKVGCLTHPDARAWLMKDVIKHLEDKDQRMFECGVKRLIPIREAIAFIKDGVKKE